MGKGKKKTHSMFHCDQTNASSFEIGGTYLGSLDNGGEGGWGGGNFFEFLENYKNNL